MTRETEPYIPEGLVSEGSSGHKLIRHRVADDPMEADSRKKIVVAVNIARDVLETEYGCGRITKSAYSVGLLIQAALEDRGGSGQAQWNEGDRIDAATTADLRIVSMLDKARTSVEIVDRMRMDLGILAGPVIEKALRTPGTWADLAAQFGRKGLRSEQFYAKVFREGLEALANEWLSVRGKAKR